MNFFKNQKKKPLENLVRIFCTVSRKNKKKEIKREENSSLILFFSI